MSELRIGLIGGTGLGALLAEQPATQRHTLDTPFGRPSDAILETEWAGTPVLLLNRHGPGHLLNPSQVNYRANIYALKALGCTHILASGAVGSLREEIQPRDLVIVDQVIDKTRRPATFFENAAVHVEFAEPFCPVMRQILIEAAEPGDSTSPPAAGTDSARRHRVHARGTYVCMEGPAFSTRAESLMHRLWGGDVIGMTAMPEAKLAREAEISYALIALVTDYDCWKPHTTPAGEAPDPFKLLNEIIGHLKDATGHAIELMKRAVVEMSRRRDDLARCPAQHALKLAIWSDKAAIPPEERKRLAPLWMKYFQSEP
ncbi:MAG: MTAP family purine nucleoside phosphorylase [Phycisphaerae bacterium]|nr:MTAP family purine nucleoside phosphorylase [Phycisphaerae bacterium]MDW8261845.1 MTAP family purine nucleoside phosphorylase [Phycisphaerales bacterium]